MRRALIVLWCACSGAAALEASVVCASRDVVLVRGALSEEAQEKLYGGLCRGAAGSLEATRLGSREDDGDRPWPLAVWRHPYTGESNMRGSHPAPLFAWARSLAAGVSRELGGDERPRVALELADFDSLVSLLYAPGGTLARHLDTGLDGLGLALSLGAACDFEVAGERLELSSGDAIFADFARREHAVLRTHPLETAPRWWRDLPPRGRGDAASTFGCSRCSVQLRRRSRGRPRSS